MTNRPTRDANSLRFFVDTMSPPCAPRSARVFGPVPSGFAFGCGATLPPTAPPEYRTSLTRLSMPDLQWRVWARLDADPGIIVGLQGKSGPRRLLWPVLTGDRKSTRLNS